MQRIPVPTLPSLRILVLFAALGALLAPRPAAALDFWGTVARTSTWLCPSFCQDVQRGPTTGGEFVATATSDIDDSRGEAHADVALDPSGGISTPRLGASAFSDGGLGSAFASAFAVEGYTNAGATTETYTLDITLTGEVFMPSSDTFIEVQLVAYREANFFFTSDRPTLELEAGATSFDDTTLRIDDAVTTEVMGSLTFSLDPGESVFVWAFLEAEAERDGAFADALGTVTTSFQDATGLVAASTVPEPGGAALLGAALLAASRRRGR